MPFRECKFVQLCDKDDIIPSTTLDQKREREGTKEEEK